MKSSVLICISSTCPDMYTLPVYPKTNKQMQDVVPPHACVVMCAVPQQVVLCKSLRDTSSRLAELGWLHNKVRKYTDARSLDRAFGLVGQVCPSLPRVSIMSR